MEHDEDDVYDSVDLEDMEYKEEEKVFLYQCPCGDKFRAELEVIRKEFEKDKERGFVIAFCPSCSLLLKVIFNGEVLKKFK